MKQFETRMMEMEESFARQLADEVSGYTHRSRLRYSHPLQAQANDRKTDMKIDILSRAQVATDEGSDEEEFDSDDDVPATPQVQMGVPRPSDATVRSALARLDD